MCSDKRVEANRASIEGVSMNTAKVSNRSGEFDFVFEEINVALGVRYTVSARVLLKIPGVDSTEYFLEFRPNPGRLCVIRRILNTCELYPDSIWDVPRDISQEEQLAVSGALPALLDELDKNERVVVPQAIAAAQGFLKGLLVKGLPDNKSAR